MRFFVLPIFNTVKIYGIQYFNRGGYRLRRHPPLKYHRCPSIMYVVCTIENGQKKSHVLSLIVSFSCLKIIDKLRNSSLRYVQ